MDKYFFFFSAVSNIGLKTILKLIDSFGSLENVFSLDREVLKDFGLRNSIIDSIFDNKHNFDFDYEISRYEKLNIKFASFFDPDYPDILKKIPDPPSIIFYKGELGSFDKSIGVVGARECTEYGISVAKDFCSYFIEKDITCISGGALGIDSIAHLVSVENNFRTVSVMGCGLDKLYPSSNKYLFEKIIDNGGAIVSEFPIGVAALPKHFVMRNRIIAGLSSGVLIVEAGLKSGTMTTASFCIDQNKNVFVVPGSIYSEYSKGTNHLIKNGAIFVTDPKEIDEMIFGVNNINNQNVGVRHALHLRGNNENKLNKKEIDISWMNIDEKNIFNLVSYKPINIEDIVLMSKIDIQKINSILIIFEIKGLIIDLGGMNYRRAN